MTVASRIKRFLIQLQYLLPQHILSALMYYLSRQSTPWIKNYFIRRFMKRYTIDLKNAITETIDGYSSFDDFFTRRLKSNLRPIASGHNTIASPVDATITNIGSIHRNQLLQAKQFYFSLETLLGDDRALAQKFYGGQVAIFYLAPHNYHRVHMPLSAHMIRTTFIPGKLFSVNRMSTEIIPNIYSRNERVVILTHMETTEQPMIIILIGALMVGSIQLAWESQAINSSYYQVSQPKTPIFLNKGDEIGCFHLGSTVILLYPPHCIQWDSKHQCGSHVLMGESLGQIIDQ